MRSILLSILILFAIHTVNAQTKNVSKPDAEIARKAQSRADQVSRKLKLDESKQTAIFNVFKQSEQRTADLIVGSPDYDRLLGYIDGERNEMLKVALSADEYKIYQKSFADRDKAEYKKLVGKSDVFGKKQNDIQKREKDRTGQIMSKDKDKETATLKKEKERIKKEEQKKAEAEKRTAKKAKEKADREAKKAKDLAKREQVKAKQVAKKEQEKAKQAAKKEQEKAKQAAKKEKERAKKEKEKSDREDKKAKKSGK